MRKRIGRLPSHFSNRPKAYPLNVVLNEIRTGQTTLRRGINIKRYTEQAREYYATDPAAYKSMKVNAPAFCAAGTLNAKRDILEPSGYLLIEFDNLGTEAGYIHWQVQQESITLAVFHSMSSEGLAAIVELETPATTPTEYQHAWLGAADAYAHIADADTAGASWNQLRAICYDKDIYVNWQSDALVWTRDDAAHKETFGNRQLSPVTTSYQGGEIVDTYFEAIRATEWKRNGWSVDSMPCPIEAHENDGWDRDTNACHVRCLDDTPGYLFHCFKCRQTLRYRLPPTE